MRIDAHQHCWECARPWHAWPDAALPAIHHDFGPRELQPLLAQCGLTHSVLVQAQPDERETEWLLQLAARHECIAAVVGWVDLAHAQAAQRIAQVRQANAKLRGLRPMLQDLDDRRWILRAELAPAIGALLDHGLRFDALVREDQLPVIEALARRYPKLPIVIDHAGKPPIATGNLARWSSWLASAAQCPNVYCKLSGLVTEGGHDWQRRGELLQACARHILECFGPGRVMWGSDWPVLNLASDYQQWHALAREWLGGDAAVERAVFGETARVFYGL